jgi:NAD(P)H-dependent flavin oxidoreductase YrpB (nitropropane dioxygenase family)
MTTTTPQIIQGGMGVGVSDWHLAKAVSQTGQLGVVSGTALDVLIARRLQRGDPDGSVRRALAAFPAPHIAEWIIDAYFAEGGIEPGKPFRAVPRHTIKSPARLVELTAAANFVEVFLAKEGHDGVVGINYLRKVEIPIPFSLYGAMLAGVDYVLMGAGSPSELPGLARALARHEEVTLEVKVSGARPAEGLGNVVFDPRTILAEPTAPLTPPKAIAIVASSDLANMLHRNEESRPDGFVIEGPSAGGHNAPPRGPRRLDEIGQPIYGERDEVDLSAVLELGLPVWLAGSYGTPERYREARAMGASGIQVGTAFAYCEESGFDPSIKSRVRETLADGGPDVRADWRVSPTGFPFRVVDLPGTLTEQAVIDERQKVCDLGALRTAYKREDGKVDYRCPAEPVDHYLRKGGREANIEGRVCLCNALLSSAGYPQRRKSGYVEPLIVTSGGDIGPVQKLIERAGGGTYGAADVIEYLLG